MAKTEAKEIEGIFAKATPKFNYVSLNGKHSGLHYFTRMTPEMYERIYHLMPANERHWFKCFHNTDIDVQQQIAGMGGILLHGYKRPGTWDMSVEGVFVPSQFAPLFLERIERERERTGNENIFRPNEWSEGYLFHYEQDGKLIATDLVGDYDDYQNFWRLGFPLPDKSIDQLPKSLHAYRRYHVEHPRRVPIVTPDTPRYWRAWWD